MASSTPSADELYAAMLASFDNAVHDTPPVESLASSSRRPSYPQHAELR